MAMMLIAPLAVVLPALQTETAQTATMQSDVDRLVRAAEGLEGPWRRGDGSVLRSVRRFPIFRSPRRLYQLRVRLVRG
jgi:hypothetical protein